MTTERLPAFPTQRHGRRPPQLTSSLPTLTDPPWRTHQEADLLERHHIEGRRRARDARARENRDDRRSRRSLSRSRADQDRRTVGGEIDQGLTDQRGGAGVDAPGRLIDQQQQRLAVEFSPTTNLRLPPESERASGSGLPLRTS